MKLKTIVICDAEFLIAGTSFIYILLHTCLQLPGRILWASAVSTYSVSISLLKLVGVLLLGDCSHDDSIHLPGVVGTGMATVGLVGVGLLWLWTILQSEPFELNCCMHDWAVLSGSTGEDVLSGLFDAVDASWLMGCRFLVELEWYRRLCLKYSSSLDVQKVYFLHRNHFSLGVVHVFTIMTSDSLTGKVVGVLPIG